MDHHTKQCSFLATAFPLLVISLITLFFTPIASADDPPALTLDESPAGSSDWGYRPEDGSTTAENPPGFCWRDQSGIVRWELRFTALDTPEEHQMSFDGATLPAYRPSNTWATGRYSWSYRGFNTDSESTNWSADRQFTIHASAASMPMPSREALLDRIPDAHPRLFVRPEYLPVLREMAEGDLSSEHQKLIDQCDRLLANPPSTEEPPLYPPGTETKDETWRVIWWGNREYTIKALNGAATLAFTRLLSGNDEYGELAKRLLLECAAWDPKGATGYRYNDEAGMPYAYYFARSYTFLHDMLTEEEREICREVMRIRGDEMYRHLCPRHLNSPYSSHSNRAWHFLGEVGIAFHGEIEAADDWTWFAMNVFYNIYPVWSDDDGGWHEGTAYWSSYVSRFTWWADVMRVAFGINAFDKPYFSKIGDYPMYLMPPGKVGGGFGDLTAGRTASSNAGLMSVLAAQANNSHWRWYVDQLGGPQSTGGYIGYVRDAYLDVTPSAPADLPTSKLFEGTGQAYLNTTLLDADDDVQVVFKSSPFGTQSHGYESNNSFLLWAYGQRLLIRTGRRDIYGSEHHTKWMWSTRSTNNITVDGVSQTPHSSGSQGRVSVFQTTPTLDVVQGESGENYTADGYPDRKVLDRYTRTILFAKPELVVVFDRLEATQPATFEYWLHAVDAFDLPETEGDQSVRLQVDDVVCPIKFLAPQGLTFEQTNEYDPNPRDRVSLREWHLTATTPDPNEGQSFVVLMRPQRESDADATPLTADLETVEGGYILRAELKDGGELIALLPTEDDVTIQSNGLETQDVVLVETRNANGNVVETLRVE